MIFLVKTILIGGQIVAPGLGTWMIGKVEIGFLSSLNFHKQTEPFSWAVANLFPFLCHDAEQTGCRSRSMYLCIGLSAARSHAVRSLRGAPKYIRTTAGQIGLILRTERAGPRSASLSATWLK